MKVANVLPEASVSASKVKSTGRSWKLPALNNPNMGQECRVRRSNRRLAPFLHPDPRLPDRPQHDVSIRICSRSRRSRSRTDLRHCRRRNRSHHRFHSAILRDSARRTFSTLGFSLGLSIPLTLLCGLVLGALVGSVIALFKINDFVVTLGGLSILAGAGLVLSGGQPVSVRSNELLQFATGGFGPIKYFIIVAIIVVLIGHFLMFNTKLGGRFGPPEETNWLQGRQASQLPP